MTAARDNLVTVEILNLARFPKQGKDWKIFSKLPMLRSQV